MAIREHHLEVARTARYVTLGEPEGARSLWYVLHGHGQLAAPFMRHFEGLAREGRCIVAPEALNRYYAEPTSWRGAGSSRVGATWMTREDRLAEISDYVRYLDTLHRHLSSAAPGARVVVLGFSQGVSTAARWVCAGTVAASAVIFWAGPLPPELNAAAVQPLKQAHVLRVLGAADDMAAADVVAAEREREQALGLDVELVTYEGGHRMDAGVLSRIAAGVDP